MESLTLPTTNVSNVTVWTSSLTTITYPTRQNNRRTPGELMIRRSGKTSISSRRTTFYYATFFWDNTTYSAGFLSPTVGVYSVELPLRRGYTSTTKNEDDGRRKTTRKSNSDDICDFKISCEICFLEYTQYIRLDQRLISIKMWVKSCQKAEG